MAYKTNYPKIATICCSYFLFNWNHHCFQEVFRPNSLFVNFLVNFCQFFFAVVPKFLINTAVTLLSLRVVLLLLFLLFLQCKPAIRWLPLILMTYNYLPQAGPTYTGWLNSLSVARAYGVGGGSPRARHFARNSNRDQLEFHTALLMYYTTQTLVKLLHGFLGPNLDWKRA